MIKMFNEWINEDDNSGSPSGVLGMNDERGVAVWKTVLTILPGLKMGWWTKTHNGFLIFHINFMNDKNAASRWFVSDEEIELCDVHIHFYSKELFGNEEGFSFWKPNIKYNHIGSGHKWEISSFSNEEPLLLDNKAVNQTMDPLVIAMMLNRDKAEKWILKNKAKGWQQIVGKKYGV